MLTLYSGFPAAIETLRVLASRWPTRVRPLGEGAPASRRDRGLRVLARVYGPVRPALLRGLDQLHPALAAWVVEHGYGRVLARPGLGLRARELVTVAMLAASGWERQLTSHVLGAGRAGATDAEVETAVREGRLAGAGRRHGHAAAPLPSTEATPALRLARLRASTRRRTRAPRPVRADRSPAARTPGRR